MPLTLAVHDDGGRTGRALRVHRGAHDLRGEGQCRRLAKLLPAHCNDNGTNAEVPFRLAYWLDLFRLFLMFVYSFELRIRI